MLFVTVAMVGVVALITIQTNKRTPASSPPGTPGPGQPLPLLQPKHPLGQLPWNISWKSEYTDAHLSKDGDSLRMTFKAGGYGSKNGIGIRAEPWKKLPADRAVFSAQVYVPPDFQWGGKVHGMKFPLGFCLGKKTGDCASGGSYESDSGSIRIMTREDGRIVAYCYIPGTSDEATLQKQGPGFKRVAHVTGSGIDLWRKVEPIFLKKGSWNTVHVKVVMNSPGKSNGLVEIGVNGTIRRVSDVNFRATADIKIQSVFISGFYGGGADYAPTKDVYLLFKNYMFST